MDTLINFFKVLSDETRLRIIMLLFHRELCVCQLTGVTGIAQPNISKHLAKLRDMGFVRDLRDEQYIFYSLNLPNNQFEGVLQTILDNIEDYPVLKSDMDKSKAADKFIELLNAKK